jgi:hypothetical protein
VRRGELFMAPEMTQGTELAVRADKIEQRKKNLDLLRHWCSRILFICEHLAR